MKVTIIRTSGATEQHEVPNGNGCFKAIEALIGAQFVDTVNLRDGRVMLVDDKGYETDPITTEVDGVSFIELRTTKALKPVNVEATKLYHAVCIPGTTHQIVGDVAICLDADF